MLWQIICCVCEKYWRIFKNTLEIIYFDVKFITSKTPRNGDNNQFYEVLLWKNSCSSLLSALLPESWPAADHSVLPMVRVRTKSGTALSSVFQSKAHSGAMESSPDLLSNNFAWHSRKNRSDNSERFFLSCFEAARHVYYMTYKNKLTFKKEIYESPAS